MPSFDTPTSISVTVDLGAVGEMLISAGERVDTVVHVRPSDESDPSDVKAAEQVRVEYTNGVLAISGPKARAFDFSRKTRSVDVAVELPSGSSVSADMQVGDLLGEGQLGECRFKTGAGNARFDRTGPLRLELGAGHVTAAEVAGSAEVTTGAGKVSLGQISGAAVVRNSNGDVLIGSAVGDVRMRTANGSLSIDRAGGGVEAKTANGSIRVGEVASGLVTMETAMGDLEIGIAEGTAAYLEVNTGFGHVRNLMDNTTRPGEADSTVEVRGRTSYGDITVRRS